MRKTMKCFKLRTGKSQVYQLEKEIYEKKQLNGPYVEIEKDKPARYFAVCPACDNPIQIIGLYSKSDNSPSVYGKHYNKSIEIAEYNKQMYYFCPYASHKYAVTKDSRKTNLTDYERNIYNTLRENFDIAVKIIEQDTGLYISDKMARRMLINFWSAEGHMYYWATLYNIPWLLLFFSPGVRCRFICVKENSPLYDFLSGRKEVKFTDAFGDYKKIDSANGKYLNLQYSVLGHKRAIVNDRLQETMSMNFFKVVNGLPKVLYSFQVNINEYRFLNWICSEDAKRYRNNPRNQRLLQIAAEELPELL